MRPARHAKLACIACKLQLTCCSSCPVSALSHVIQLRTHTRATSSYTSQHTFQRQTIGQSLDLHCNITMAALTCTSGLAARPTVTLPSHHKSCIAHSRASFSGTALQMQHARGTQIKSGRAAVVDVKSFKFMKKLGLKKPEFLPDFGKV